MDQWDDRVQLMHSLLGWFKHENDKLTTMLLQGAADLSILQEQRIQLELIVLELDAKREVTQSAINAVNPAEIQNSIQSSTSDSDPFPLDEVVKLAKELSEEWKSSQKKSSQLKKRLDTLIPALENLWSDLNVCDSSLQDIESLKESWKNVGELSTELLQENVAQMDACKTDYVKPLQKLMKSLETHVNFLHKTNMGLSSKAQHKLDELRMRWKIIQVYWDERAKQLHDAVRDFGPNSQLFLTASVERPWQRAVSANQVPYYIDHVTRCTSWDHPKMTELLDSMSDLNDVRFSAYRTAMKLHRLQKALCLDLLPIQAAKQAFHDHKLIVKNMNGELQSMNVIGIIKCLTTLYDTLERNHSAVVNVPLCVDMCLNWLLNIHDSERKGKVDVLSFVVAITCLCKASIEEKYRYLFRQMAAAHSGFIDDVQLSRLIEEFMKIPWQIHESRMFGNCNATPSVRSCFQITGNKPEIDASDFIDWMKLEPQSLVWMPVLHRLAAAAHLTHMVTCSICHDHPIAGLRYRCLRFFNYNICQNCFFSGQVAKRHKFLYPIVEYCSPTTSTENIRDFTKVLKNKLRGSKSQKKKIGYLPVSTILDGDVSENHKMSHSTDLPSPAFTTTVPSTRGHVQLSDAEPSPTVQEASVAIQHASPRLTSNSSNAAPRKQQVLFAVEPVHLSHVVFPTPHLTIEGFARRLAAIDEISAKMAANSVQAGDCKVILRYAEATGLRKPQNKIDTSLYRHSAVFEAHEIESPFQTPDNAGDARLPAPSFNPPYLQQNESDQSSPADSTNYQILPKTISEDEDSADSPALSDDNSVLPSNILPISLDTDSPGHHQRRVKMENEVKMLDQHNKRIQNQLDELKSFIVTDSDSEAVSSYPNGELPSSKLPGVSFSDSYDRRENGVGFESASSHINRLLLSTGHLAPALDKAQFDVT